MNTGICKHSHGYLDQKCNLQVIYYMFEMEGIVVKYNIYLEISIDLLPDVRSAILYSLFWWKCQTNPAQCSLTTISYTLNWVAETHNCHPSWSRQELPTIVLVKVYINIHEMYWKGKFYSTCNLKYKQAMNKVLQRNW